jgi:GNAT superfamily N-acetyltransferase
MQLILSCTNNDLLPFYYIYLNHKTHNMNIQEAISTEELIKCFEVMKALRPHHSTESFLAVMEQMKSENYRLLYLEEKGEIVCLAGYRLTTTLYDGLILDLDDFVTGPPARKKGFAGLLFDELIQIAKAKDVKAIHLNSNHQRFDAHRFYLQKKMNIIAHHFRIAI